MYTNTYIVSIAKKECIVIDPGADPGFIKASLDKINMTPKAIIFTHGHIDHTSGAKALQRAYKEKEPNLLVWMHEADFPFLDPDNSQRDQLNRLFLPGDNPEADRVFEDLYQDLPHIDSFLSHGDIIPETDLQVIHTPGHTPGSICLYSEERSALFTGDTLFFDAIGRSDFPGADEQVLMESIQTKLLVLPHETRIFPGHGPFSTIERELRDNQMKTDHGML
ncbi:MBL fold metallo-hydrolase [Spirochaeta lutea]|nr:MBL fold metallo-hydrolase [Spirochaeta lutea]